MFFAKLSTDFANSVKIFFCLLVETCKMFLNQIIYFRLEYVGKDYRRTKRDKKNEPRCEIFLRKLKVFKPPSGFV